MATWAEFEARAADLAAFGRERGRDVRARGWYALHNDVPDTVGTGGEFTLSGRGLPVEDPELRTAACDVVRRPRMKPPPPGRGSSSG